MIGLKRIANPARVHRDRGDPTTPPGDLIETGVWRGGAATMMRGVLAAYGDDTAQGCRASLAPTTCGVSSTPDAPS
jgi:O-methyltransferase